MHRQPLRVHSVQSPSAPSQCILIASLTRSVEGAGEGGRGARGGGPGVRDVELDRHLAALHDGTRRGRNGHRERARSGGVRLLPQIEGIFRTVGGA